MRAHPQEERPVNFLQRAVVADGLRNGKDVPLIECPVESGAAMAGRAKDYPLAWVVRVRPQRVVGRDELRNVYQHCRVGRFSRVHIHFHLSPHRKSRISTRTGDRRTALENLIDNVKHASETAFWMPATRSVRPEPSVRRSVRNS